MKKLLTTAALAALVAAPALAQQTFDFKYASGGATAVGTFDLAHSGSVLAAGNYAGLISNVHMTISGASSGNGTFGPSDFGSYYFNTSTDLDLTHELVGQSEGGTNVFGDQSTASDLNFFGNSADAPLGTWFFTLTTADGQGQPLLLTSLHLDGVNGAVPEPASWAMMLGGFGLVGGAMRSRRKAAVTFA